MGLFGMLKGAGKTALNSDVAETGAKWGLAAANGMGVGALTGAVMGATLGVVDEDTSVIGGALFGAAAGAIVPGALSAAKGAWDEGVTGALKAAGEDGLKTAESAAKTAAKKVGEGLENLNTRAAGTAAPKPPATGSTGSATTGPASGGNTSLDGNAAVNAFNKSLDNTMTPVPSKWNPLNHTTKGKKKIELINRQNRIKKFRQKAAQKEVARQRKEELKAKRQAIKNKEAKELQKKKLAEEAAFLKKKELRRGAEARSFDNANAGVRQEAQARTDFLNKIDASSARRSSGRRAATDFANEPATVTSSRIPVKKVKNMPNDPFSNAKPLSSPSLEGAAATARAAKIADPNDFGYLG